MFVIVQLTRLELKYYQAERLIGELRLHVLNLHYFPPQNIIEEMKKSSNVGNEICKNWSRSR